MINSGQEQRPPEEMSEAELDAELARTGQSIRRIKEETVAARREAVAGGRGHNALAEFLARRNQKRRPPWM